MRINASGDCQQNRNHDAIIRVLGKELMRALISDVHGNLEALDAVENQTAGLEIICLGDVVCYGPDSIECVRRSGSWHSVVAGPLDTSMLDHRPDQWSPTINATIQRLRKRFSDSPDARELLKRSLRINRSSHRTESCISMASPETCETGFFQKKSTAEKNSTASPTIHNMRSSGAAPTSLASFAGTNRIGNSRLLRMARHTICQPTRKLSSP